MPGSQVYMYEGDQAYNTHSNADFIPDQVEKMFSVLFKYLIWYCTYIASIISFVVLTVGVKITDSTISIYITDLILHSLASLLTRSHVTITIRIAICLLHYCFFKTLLEKQPADSGRFSPYHNEYTYELPRLVVPLPQWVHIWAAQVSCPPTTMSTHMSYQG